MNSSRRQSMLGMKWIAILVILIPSLIKAQAPATEKGKIKNYMFVDILAVSRIHSAISALFTVLFKDLFDFMQIYIVKSLFRMVCAVLG